MIGCTDSTLLLRHAFWLLSFSCTVLCNSHLLRPVHLLCFHAIGSEDEQQDTDKAGDLLAANLGIDHFSVMLRRAAKQEEEDVLGQAKRPK